MADINPSLHAASEGATSEAPVTLKARITEDMKNALRAHDSARLSTIRMLLAAIKQREVDERIELTDADVLAIIDKMIKQRKDSVSHFEAGRRADLVATEEGEIATLQTYLPQPLSDAEIDALIADAISAAGVSGSAGMGKVMAILKPALAGRADLAAASARVKARLASL